MSSKQIDDGGPIRVPVNPPDPTTAVLIFEKLKGHSTSLKWLPENTGWSEMDELRDEHRRIRAEIVGVIDAWHALSAKFKAEDAEFAEKQRQAFRTAGRQPEDDRTSIEQRASERAALEQLLWAGVVVLAEHVDRVRATFVKNEAVWLADLKSQVGPAQEKRRAAQRLLQEARQEEFHVSMLGQWLQTESDGGVMSRQPAPTVGPVPARFDATLMRSALERPWHRETVEPLPKSWTEIEQPAKRAYKPFPAPGPNELESDDPPEDNSLILPLGKVGS